MIPRANITAWRPRAPWPANEQVEQDLKREITRREEVEHSLCSRAQAQIVGDDDQRLEQEQAVIGKKFCHGQTARPTLFFCSTCSAR